MLETKEAPSKEDIARMEAEREKQKKELINFYKSELPLLRLQKEYEDCLTSIEISKLERLQVMMAKAQMQAQHMEKPVEKEQETQKDGANS